MPIYEYECVACGHTFEAMQSFKDEALLDCPVCNESALKKLISTSAFHLKGSGWYVTDFKNPVPPKTNSKETANETDTNKKVENAAQETNKETTKEGKIKEAEPAKPAVKATKTDASGEKSS